MTAADAKTGTDGISKSNVIHGQVFAAITENEAAARKRGSGKTIIGIDLSAAGNSTGVALTFPHAAFAALTDSAVVGLRISSPFAGNNIWS